MPQDTFRPFTQEELDIVLGPMRPTESLPRTAPTALTPCTAPGGIAATASRIGEMLERKNSSYGAAYSRCGDFMRLLFPNGLRPADYDRVLFVVRILDKLTRISTAKDSCGEDPFEDIAGYALLELSTRPAAKE